MAGWLGTPVVDTPAITGDEEIVAAVWVTVVVVEVSIDERRDHTGGNGGQEARGGNPSEHSGGDKTCPKRIAQGGPPAL